jgi:hypothetical protein
MTGRLACARAGLLAHFLCHGARFPPNGVVCIPGVCVCVCVCACVFVFMFVFVFVFVYVCRSVRPCLVPGIQQPVAVSPARGRNVLAL